MTSEQLKRRAFSRARNAFAIVVGAALAAVSMPAAAQQKVVDSYQFHGLQWGMKMSEARKMLAHAGYHVVGVAAGKRREFAIDRLHAVYENIDRGRRLIASGRFEGYPVTVHLAFGKHDSLNQIFIMSPYWNRTVAGAQVLIKEAEKTVSALEQQYGTARKRIDDRWPDTAYWGNARDGSTLTVHVRGINGFMFSPSYRTAMRIDYANARYNNGHVLGVRVDLNSTGWTGGPAAVVTAVATSGAPEQAVKTATDAPAVATKTAAAPATAQLLSGVFIGR
jgi:hypothetical protein